MLESQKQFILFQVFLIAFFIYKKASLKQQGSEFMSSRIFLFGGCFFPLLS